MNLANKLTLFRILVIPPFVLSFYWNTVLCVTLFILAALTDFLDGWVARHFNQETPLGKFLDPVADKLIVICALFLITAAYQTWWITLAALMIALREITVASLREWLAQARARTLPVSFWGKLKTTTQLLALTVLLTQAELTSSWGVLGGLLLWLAAGLALLSLGQYIWHNRAAFAPIDTLK